MKNATFKGRDDRTTWSGCRTAVKSAALFIAMALLLLSYAPAQACVGKVLTIGIVHSPQESIYAELIAQMVTERTGTAVKIVSYKDVRELYDAVRKGEVGVLIENTERGMEMMKRPPVANGKSAYETLKLEYRQSLNLIWLEPVSADGGSCYYAPVIATETMDNLPALPKLINRLTGVLTEGIYARLWRGVGSEEKPRRLARDFLKAKKLI
jgi:glycine betaine/choline ABC-type transport system substrate-binding protein